MSRTPVPPSHGAATRFSSPAQRRQARMKCVLPGMNDERPMDLKQVPAADDMSLFGKTLAHINKRMVGKDNINLQDANGKFHVKERLEIVKAKGEQAFAFLNPMTKQIEAKLMYFERVGDIIVACGACKPL
jgi:hypothetical protein